MRGTEGELDRCFGLLPTNEPFRKWTPEESDWYSTHWTRDHVAMNDRCGRQNGNSATDKSCSGEYMLDRPPKKPGGLLRTSLFLLILWIAVGSVECKKEEGGVFEDSAPGNESSNESFKEGLDRGKFHVGQNVLSLILVGITASRCKLWELAKIFPIGLHLVDPYEDALELFFERNNIKERANCRMVQSVFWTSLVRDTLEV